MMRVLFLTLYPECVASARYRVHQFMPHLEQLGVQATVASPLTAAEYLAWAGPQGCPRRYHLTELRRRFIQILAGRRYDVVVVQKAATTAYVRGLAGLVRRCARRLVYDFDDAVHLQPPVALRGVWRLAEDRAHVRRILAAADLVLAGNAWLASAAEELGARTVVWPTVVDTDQFTPPAEPPRRFRIGWIGNPSTAAHLGIAADALSDTTDTEIVLVGAGATAVPWPSAKAVPWRLETEVAEIQQFSAGLMPLPSDDWARGKCGLKALQYMACGVPCIASAWGVASGIIEHGRNGFLASSPSEWRDAVEALRNPAVRARLSAAARATVVERYALSSAAPRFRDLLESVR